MEFKFKKWNTMFEGIHPFTKEMFVEVEEKVHDKLNSLPESEADSFLEDMAKYCKSGDVYNQVRELIWLLPNSVFLDDESEHWDEVSKFESKWDQDFKKASLKDKYKNVNETFTRMFPNEL